MLPPPPPPPPQAGDEGPTSHHSGWGVTQGHRLGTSWPQGCWCTHCTLELQVPTAQERPHQAEVTVYLAMMAPVSPTEEFTDSRNSLFGQ